MKRIWTPLAVLAIVGAGVAADNTAQASAPHRNQPAPHPDGRAAATVLHVGVAQAFVCDGVLETITNLESLQGKAWQFTQDDGREDIQVQHDDNSWTSVGSTSGGEGRRRWTGYAQATGLTGAVRVIRTDGSAITSTPRLLGECPYPPR